MKGYIKVTLDKEQQEKVESFLKVRSDYITRYSKPTTKEGRFLGFLWKKKIKYLSKPDESPPRGLYLASYLEGLVENWYIKEEWWVSSFVDISIILLRGEEVLLDQEAYRVLQNILKD